MQVGKKVTRCAVIIQFPTLSAWLGPENQLHYCPTPLTILPTTQPFRNPMDGLGSLDFFPSWEGESRVGVGGGDILLTEPLTQVLRTPAGNKGFLQVLSPIWLFHS